MNFKFRVIYNVGESVREQIISARNLDEAEEIADAKFSNWTDIIYIDKTKGESCN